MLCILLLFSLLWCSILNVGVVANSKDDDNGDLDNTTNTNKFYTYSFNRYELDQYRLETKELFDFALDNYLNIGYPFDEVKPLSCVPKTRNFTHNDLITNDVLGNFTLTLFDSLTTCAVMNDKKRFVELIALITLNYPQDTKFNHLNSTVQVFETTIRIIGGLLSSHLYATDPTKKVYLADSYDNSLLSLAQDMADRLLPAYLTDTGLPVARINLQDPSKTNPDLLQENNIAAIMSPIFEFTLLSYLTLDQKYEKVTRYAYDKIWSLRSQLDLLPMSINPNDLKTYSFITGIGASIDSFYEYTLKSAILFNDSSLYKIWLKSYNALKIFCKNDWFFVNINYINGQLVSNWIDSLSAFFPGLQVLNGDISDATFKNLINLKFWDYFGGIPERWNFQRIINDNSNKGSKFNTNQNTNTNNNNDKQTNPQNFASNLDKLQQLKDSISLEWYPLRPEFIESTYFLYRATKDPFYLNIGYQILQRLKTIFKGECGFAGIQNIFTGQLQDRMETFILSETLKYLYLLFDEHNELHQLSDNIIFSTEAHPMWLSYKQINNYKKNSFFNDSNFIQHLNYCKLKDEKDAKIQRDKKNSQNTHNNFLKGLFNRNHDYKEIPSQNENHFNKQLIESQYCFVSDNNNKPFIQNNNYYEKQSRSSLLHSNLLSTFNRLFEPDIRYSDTLIKPDYLKDYSPFELAEPFYTQWSNSNGFSKAMQTTESYELLFNFPGEYYIHSVHNTNLNMTDLYCGDFTGHRKIRIEKLAPGKISSYGEILGDDILDNTNYDDISNVEKDNSSNFESGSFVLRATILDGNILGSNSSIILNKDAIMKSVTAYSESASQKDFNFFKIFGLNSDNQLTLQGIPIINIFLV
ncbi:hypothetical protein TBLA_0E04960 [Henningerozyma blattae CBS 6284]|uniref:alpha-1,2-Mannosidase n=1 Tax=Henningerozyma blattae (strain ATCC 34711 / CBS 6284 / DSM 70876 / NBRC 10599 / NRRL Y-10934 / UCD 77-7) TaxID=1071380 RepID=I2H593_HENB6|nr:hypothetical protein TBLA_0E04960 [Tetrapisispora blattae CBS 6284]CCH61545.1 hypothetical protein TBLA_0E04960 [Tetrapisispora blattae CBS 6284]